MNLHKEYIEYTVGKIKKANKSYFVQQLGSSTGSII